MPLTVNNGTSLSPQPAGAPPQQQRMVNIPHRPQRGRLWCWAACVQMVLEHNEIQLSQCNIVRRHLNDPQHVCAQDPNARNESCPAPQMRETWHRCGIPEVEPINWEIPMQTIKDEIAADRPIQVGIIWNEGGGHAILIKGWAATSPEALLIDDPLRQSSVGESKFGTGRATYDDLLDALGHGTWRYTWINLED
jgi:Papain-like cysteine protease AvrRpt2